MLSLFTLFLIKHFLCDFPLQTRYQYSNKGILWHPGGLLHAFITIAGSAIILLLWGFLEFEVLGFLLAFEFVIHYFMDWAKVNINEYYDWKPNTSEYYWWLLGFDQLVHMLTYVVMIAVIGWITMDSHGYFLLNM